MRMKVALRIWKGPGKVRCLLPSLLVCSVGMVVDSSSSTTDLIQEVVWSKAPEKGYQNNVN